MTTIALSRTHSSAPALVAGARPVGSRSAVVQSARVGLVASAAAVPPVVFLHLNATETVEPVGWTISDYVVTLPYGIPLFAMTAGALAVAGAGLVRGLARSAGTRVLRWMLAVWSVSLVLAAVFPTNLRGTPENLSSNIHLIAGAAVFALLPVAGLLLARRQLRASGRDATSVSLAVLSAISGILSTALILNRLPGVFGMPQLMLPPGILQRVAGAAEIVLLAVMALAMLRSARRAA